MPFAFGVLAQEPPKSEKNKKATNSKEFVVSDIDKINLFFLH